MAAKAAVKLSAVEKLTKTHNLESFSSGKPSLDDWLKKYALMNQAGDGAQTFVVHRGNVVVGYYALAAGSIRTTDASERTAKGQPKKGTVPMILLACLAIDETEQGRGLGKALLKDALLRALQVADIIGARAVLAHALDKQAKDFYLSFDFESSPVDELTVMLLMKDIRGQMV